MKTGDAVRVYPHGSPAKAATAEVVLLSGNGRSIAVAFGEISPPFRIVQGEIEGVAIHPEHGIMLLAHREELNGEPWGPWVELFGGGHYEIEDSVDENEREKEE